MLRGETRDNRLPYALGNLHIRWGRQSLVRAMTCVSSGLIALDILYAYTTPIGAFTSGGGQHVGSKEVDGILFPLFSPFYRALFMPACHCYSIIRLDLRH